MESGIKYCLSNTTQVKFHNSNPYIDSSVVASNNATLLLSKYRHT